PDAARCAGDQRHLSLEIHFHDELRPIAARRALECAAFSLRFWSGEHNHAKRREDAPHSKNDDRNLRSIIADGMIRRSLAYTGAERHRNSFRAVSFLFCTTDIWTDRYAPTAAMRASSLSRNSAIACSTDGSRSLHLM